MNFSPEGVVSSSCCLVVDLKSISFYYISSCLAVDDKICPALLRANVSCNASNVFGVKACY